MNKEIVVAIIAPVIVSAPVQAQNFQIEQKSDAQMMKEIKEKITKQNEQTFGRQLKSVFDKKNFAPQMTVSAEEASAINAKLTNIYSKKSVREALEKAYPVIVSNYGENGQVLYDKYFQDIQDKIKKVTSPTKGTGNQDSTSLGPQATDYDNCYTSPTKTGENLAPAGMGCICHGACHGQCGSAPSNKLLMNNGIDSFEGAHLSWFQGLEIMLQHGNRIVSLDIQEQFNTAIYRVGSSYQSAEKKKAPVLGLFLSCC